MTGAEELGAALLRLPEVLEEVEVLRRRVGALEAVLERAGRDAERPHSDLLILNTGQAAEYTGRHPATVTKAAQAGELHASQRTVGGRWRIRRECIDAWVDRRPCHHQAGGEASPS